MDIVICSKWSMRTLLCLVIYPLEIYFGMDGRQKVSGYVLLVRKHPIGNATMRHNLRKEEVIRRWAYLKASWISFEWQVAKRLMKVDLAMSRQAFILRPWPVSIG